MKTHSIKFNFIMNALLTLSSVIFPIITFPYISRVLGVRGSGDVAAALSTVSYFTMFASLGVPTYGIRACARVRDDKAKLSQTVQELLIINAVTTAVIYMIFFGCLAVVPKFNGQKEFLMVVSISIILNTMGMQWLYNALEQYSYITVCSLSFKVLGIILMFAMIHSPDDYLKYGAISAISSYGSGIMNFINMRKYVSLKKTEFYDFKRHMKPLFTFFFMSAATSIYLNLDMVMLWLMKTNWDTGIYNAAIKIKTVLVNLVTSLGTVLLPRMSFYIEKGEQEAFKNTVTKAFRFVTVAATGMMIFFMIFAKESILILSGDAFLPAILPMQLLMITLLLIGLSNITGMQILTPMGQEDKVLKSIVAGAVVDFTLNLVLIPRYASTGAAFATVMAETIVVIVQFIYLRDILKGLLKNIQFFKIIAALILGSAGAILLKVNMNFDGSSTFIRLVIMAAEAIVFFALYGGSLLLMKEPLIMEMKEMGINMLKRKK